MVKRTTNWYVDPFTGLSIFVNRCTWEPRPGLRLLGVLLFGYPRGQILSIDKPLCVFNCFLLISVLGDVFAELIPSLKFYTTYSLQFQTGTKLVTELDRKEKVHFSIPSLPLLKKLYANSSILKVHTFLDQQAENPVCSGLDFNAFLIMPIQSTFVQLPSPRECKTRFTDFLLFRNSTLQSLG